MESEINWEALARFVAGESPDEEHERILAWAEADARNRALLDSARKTWRASGVAASTWDAKAAWARVQPRLVEAPHDAQVLAFRERWTARLGTRPARWLLAASVAALVTAGAALVAIRLWTQEGEVATAQEFTTPNGGRATVRLADGSTVVLGPASKLSLSRRFGRPRREVVLTGEAYFQVFHDVSHPFVVRAGSAVTQVLGTQFDVRAYPEAGTVRVVVAEGRVSFASRTQPRQPAVLLPGDLGELSAGGAVTRRRVDPAIFLGWRQGILTFDDTPLNEVVAELVRWYGVQVRIGDPSLRSRRITASFRDQSVDEVTAVIAASLGLECVKIGDVRTFVAKDAITALARS